MSGTIVNVLAPSGHRKNVKVQPNTTILKILEEVCEKFKLDANEYDLKHHKRILDLTTSFRFSGLPNNAQLEMVEAQKKRQDVEVEIVIQLGDGARLDGKFKPITTILEIIVQLCPNELTGVDLFAIYMRTEIGSDKLAETTLKDLGLISGRAIIRLVHRDPNAAKIQANVALNLQPKPSEEKIEENRETKIRKTEENTTSVSSTPNISQSLIEVIKEEKKKEEVASTIPTFSGTGHRLDEVQTIEQKSTEDENMEIDPSEASKENVMEEEDIGEIHILGERNAVIFTQDAATAVNLNDLPDSFFDLNVNDLKLLIKDLKTQSEGTIEQPLMTSKLREMEEDQKRLSMLSRYNTVIIRIQFPNRYVLQGSFTPYETIESVIEFVRSYLANQNTDFYLYLTPPKTILSKESRLFEVSCVPSAVLHFGSEDRQENYLKEDILDKISSPKASLMQALSDRGIKNSSGPSTSDEGQATSSFQPARKSNALNFSSSAQAPSDVKLPKWFKSFGK